LIGKTDAGIYADSHADATVPDDQRVIDEGKPIIHKEEQIPDEVEDFYSFEYIAQQYDNELVTEKERFNEWALTSKVPWYKDGEIVGLIGITLDISDRKHYERSLRRHAERLEQFLSEVAHDVRSPLQVADSNVELLSEGDVDQERIDAVQRAHGRIEELVEELRTFAAHGELDPEPESVDLKAAVRDVWHRHETTEATLSVGGLPTVEADPTQLDRLLDNPIDNAVDHAGQEVAVKVGPIEDGDGFYVADDGPGVPPGEREQIFETGHTTSSRGTGLGLAIVETVAARHGWSVTVTESDTGGARFDVRFEP
jgi:signal transduction histidine kinase